MALTILVFDGAGTAGRTSHVVDAVVERLQKKTGAAAVWVAWPASLMGVGGTTPWPTATEDAIRWAHDYMWRHEGNYILVGFSAGCRPAREFLERHPGLKGRVIALSLLADPWQPTTRQQHGIEDVPGFGVMGQAYGPIPDRTLFCGHPDDPICRAAPDSLLRYLAASTDAVPGGLFAAFIDKAARGRLQLIPFLGLPPWEWLWGLGPRIDRSVREARAYLSEGKHTTAYVKPYPTPDGKTDSLAHRLADSTVWLIRNRS